MHDVLAFEAAKQNKEHKEESPSHVSALPKLTLAFACCETAWRFLE